MTHRFVAEGATLACAAAALATGASAQVIYTAPDDAGVAGKSQHHLFEAPTRIKAGGSYVRTEAPGYAAPAWHDVDGDGRRDLIVGQFTGGKMQVYKSTGAGAFAAGEWLEAGGDVAEVPGVW